MTLRSDEDTPDHGLNEALAGRSRVTLAKNFWLEVAAFFLFQTREIGSEMGKSDQAPEQLSAPGLFGEFNFY
jgi:hypothetical protein